MIEKQDWTVRNLARKVFSLLLSLFQIALCYRGSGLQALKYPQLPLRCNTMSCHVLPCCTVSLFDEPELGMQNPVRQQISILQRSQTKRQKPGSKHCKISEVLLSTYVCCFKNLLSLPYFNIPVEVNEVILLKRRVKLKELQIYLIKWNDFSHWQ